MSISADGTITPSLDILEDLQLAVQRRLETHPYFANTGEIGGLLVKIEDKGSLEAKINTKLARLGLAVIITLPQVGLKTNNSPAKYLGAVSIQVSIVENWLVNRGPTGSQKKGSAVALAALYLLHHWTPAGLGACLYARVPDSIVQVNDPRRENEIGWDVTFNTALPLVAPELAA